jgi:hypothetical protein
MTGFFPRSFYVNWPRPKYDIQRSLLQSWRYLGGWQIQPGWNGESRACWGVSEEGFKDTEHRVRTPNTQTDINTTDRNAPNPQVGYTSGILALLLLALLLQALAD